jgi:hypothetical protein
MPRKAPKEVVEHRITFGDFERKELKDMINSYQQDKVLENVPNIMLGTAGLVVAGTLAAVGYAVYYWLDSVPSIIESVKNRLNVAPNKVKEAFTRARYASFSTLEEVNAAWDEEEARLQNKILFAQKFITAYDNGEIGKFHPEWLVNAQRKIVANETETMANFAIEKSDYISRWQEWKAQQV